MSTFNNNIYSIGEALKIECPNNDCKLFLYDFNMFQSLKNDLENMVSCSDYTKRIVEKEIRRL